MDQGCCSLVVHTTSLRLRFSRCHSSRLLVTRDHLKLPLSVFRTVVHGMAIGPIPYSNRLLSNKLPSALEKLEAPLGSSLGQYIELILHSLGITALGRLPKPNVFLEARDHLPAVASRLIWRYFLRGFSPLKSK
jgi:hypothetical protein